MPQIEKRGLGFCRPASDSHWPWKSPGESVTWKKLSLVMAEGNQVSRQLRASWGWYSQPLGTGASALERRPGWRASVSIIRRQWLLPLTLVSKCLCPHRYTQSIHYSLNIWTSWGNFVSRWDRANTPTIHETPASTHTHRLTLSCNMPWNIPSQSIIIKWLHCDSLLQQNIMQLPTA